MSSQSECTHEVPGEYVVDGMTLLGLHSKETIQQIKDGVAPHFDVLVATPQRSGKQYSWFSFHANIFMNLFQQCVDTIDVIRLLTIESMHF